MVSSRNLGRPPRRDKVGRRLRAAVEQFDRRLTVSVYNGHVGSYLIHPVDGPDPMKVYFCFDERTGGDSPFRLTSLSNFSSEAGWGRLMVQAFQAAHPGITRWPGTPILESGVVFWDKMQRELGITIVDENGEPRLDPEKLRDRLIRLTVTQAHGPTGPTHTTQMQPRTPRGTRDGGRWRRVRRPEPEVDLSGECVTSRRLGAP